MNGVVPGGSGQGLDFFLFLGEDFSYVPREAEAAATGKAGGGRGVEVLGAL